MLPVLIPIAALLLSDALLLVGHGLLLTMLPIAAQSAGFSATQVALTGSAYFLGFVSGCLLTPYAVRRVGHIRSFAVLASSYSALVLVFPILPEFAVWLLLRFLVGASISGLYMIIESWLNERATGENRGTVLSIYTVINLLMMTVGQQLLNLPITDPNHLFGIAAILLSVAIIPVSLTLALAPAPLQNVSISLPKVWRSSHIGVIGAIVSGLVTGAFWSLAPLYAKTQGLETFQLTVFMSATVLGGAVFQLPLGRLSDRHDRRFVVGYTSVGGALVSLMIVLAPVFQLPHMQWLLCVLAFFWGGMVMTQYAICLAHANDYAAPEDFVMVGSGMLLTTGFCAALGGPMASFLMKFMGPGGLFAFTGIVLVVFSVIIAVRRHNHVLTPVEVPEPFRAVAETTGPTAYEMDPRTQGEAQEREEKVREATVQEPPAQTARE